MTALKMILILMELYISFAFCYSGVKALAPLFLVTLNSCELFIQGMKAGESSTQEAVIIITSVIIDVHLPKSNDASQLC